MNGENLTQLSLWDRFKIAITPVSHAETLVNEMYAPEHRGMAGLPGFIPVQEFEPESAATPQIFVETKRAVVAPFKQVAGALTGTLRKFGLIAFVGIALLLILAVGTKAFVTR